MDRWVDIRAPDGHGLSAYLASLSDAPAPAIVVIQEIFGVTTELMTIAERFSENGYRVVVPALYDRIEEDYVLDYTQPGLARSAKNQLRYDEIELDIAAAITLADTGRGVALLGYCWGGGLAYSMAQKHSVRAVVSYYGTGLTQYCKSSPPEAPCQFHLGMDDLMIDAEARRAVQGSCKSSDQYFEYEGAGHAFANVARPSYRQDQAALANSRCLTFLDQVFAC